MPRIVATPPVDERWLGPRQELVLRWLLEQHEGPGGVLERTKYAKGVPWSAAAILGREPEGSEGASVAQSIRALERRGLVKRTRKHPRDPRVKLTPDGAFLAVAIRARASHRDESA